MTARVFFCERVPEHTATIAMGQRWKQIRFRFTLRALLCVVTGAALIASCLRWQFVCHREQWTREQQAIEAIERAQGWRLVAGIESTGPQWFALLAQDKYGQHVVQLDLTGCRFSKGDLRMLAAFKDLRSLDLTNSRMGEEDEALLAGENGDVFAQLRALDTLDLTASTFNDAAMEHLNRLPNLRVLRLGQTRVTDHGVMALGSKRTLERLSLDRTSVSSKSIGHLCRIAPNLKELGLAASRVDDSALREISKLRQLEALSIIETRVTGAGLDYLMTLPLLGRLDMSGISVSAEDVAHIRAPPAINSVSIAPINDDGVAQLADLSGLVDLNLHGKGVTDASLEHLKKAPALRNLALMGTSVTKRGLASFTAAMPNVTVHWD